MKTQALLIGLALICAPQGFCGQSQASTWSQGDEFTSTPVKGTIPSPSALIEGSYTGPTKFASNGQTGNFYIRYSDGAKVLVWKAPKKKITMPAMGPGDDKQIGVARIEVARDGRTIGWTEMGAPCCESYPLAMAIGIYKSGKRVLHIEGSGMLDYWTMLGKGDRIVAVWGPAHGPQVLDYQLIDIETDHVIADVVSNSKTQKLDPDAPKWALKVQASIEGGD